MCVLYLGFRYKIRPRTFGCIAMANAVLFILRYRSLLYAAGSGVNRIQNLFLTAHSTQNQIGYISANQRIYSSLSGILGHCFTTYSGLGRTFTTYPGRGLVLRHTRIGVHFRVKGANRVQVVLSGFSVICFVLSMKKLHVGMVVCISWLHSCFCV